MLPIEPETSQIARQLSRVSALRSLAIIASHCASMTCVSRFAMRARSDPLLICLKLGDATAFASSMCGRSVAPEILDLPSATLSR